MEKGIGKFGDHLVFGFLEKNLYLFESWKYGRATYVYEGKGWREASKYTKKELLEQGKCTRIIHNSKWSEKMAKLFGMEKLPEGTKDQGHITNTDNSKINNKIDNSRHRSPHDFDSFDSKKR